MPQKHIDRMVRTASHHYKTYAIPKRDGGTRTIEHPSKKLKALQRWLLTNVLEGLPVHPAAMAYKEGHLYLRQCKGHANSKYLLRMDMKEFLPSITTTDVRNYVAAKPQPTPQLDGRDINGFCSLVFRNGKLTIGAPLRPPFQMRSASSSTRLCTV